MTDTLILAQPLAICFDTRRQSSGESFLNTQAKSAQSGQKDGSQDSRNDTHERNVDALVKLLMLSLMRIVKEL